MKHFPKAFPSEGKVGRAESRLSEKSSDSRGSDEVNSPDNMRTCNREEHLIRQARIYLIMLSILVPRLTPSGAAARPSLKTVHWTVFLALRPPCEGKAFGCVFQLVF